MSLIGFAFNYGGFWCLIYVMVGLENRVVLKLVVLGSVVHIIFVQRRLTCWLANN